MSEVEGWVDGRRGAVQYDRTLALLRERSRSSLELEIVGPTLCGIAGVGMLIEQKAKSARY